MAGITPQVTQTGGVVWSDASPKSGSAGHVAGKRILSAPEIDEVLQKLNSAARTMGTNLSFSVDGTTKKTVVTVTDAQTGEVIRQIPSEEMLKVSRMITELLGVLVDHSA